LCQDQSRFDQAIIRRYILTGYHSETPFVFGHSMCRFGA